MARFDAPPELFSSQSSEGGGGQPETRMGQLAKQILEQGVGGHTPDECFAASAFRSLPQLYAPLLGSGGTASASPAAEDGPGDWRRYKRVRDE